MYEILSLIERLQLINKDKYEITVGNNGRYYYLKTHYTTLDADMARMANLSLNEYSNTMINSFHGFMKKGIKFSDKKNADAAKDWLESVIIMNKLVGDK